MKKKCRLKHKWEELKRNYVLQPSGAIHVYATRRCQTCGFIDVKLIDANAPAPDTWPRTIL